MARYGSDQIEFAILGLVRDPVHQLREKLAQNIRCLQKFSEQNLKNPGMRKWGFDCHQETLLGPDPRYGIDQNTLDCVDQHQGIGPESQAGANDGETFKILVQELSEAQRTLRMSVAEAQEADQQDEQKSDGRRFEYGPILHAWVLFHARKGAIHEILAAAQT